MKKYIVMLLLILAIVAVCTVSYADAETGGQCGENVYWSFDEQSGTLTISGEGEMQYQPTYGFEIFKDNIRTIVVEEGVERIERFRLSSLKRVEIHAKEVGANTFMHCSKLEEVVLDGVESIETDAFYACESIKRLVIPDSMTKLNCYAFTACTGLTEVVIPDSVTQITGKFDSCTSLEKVSLGRGIKKIGREVFGESIKQIHIKDIDSWLSFKREIKLNELETQYDAENANFYNGAMLFINGKQVTDVVVPEGTKSVGAYAFKGIRGISSVTLPEGLESIGDQAFAGCIITEITIPEGVKSIGARAFMGTKLKKVVIPDSVQTIGKECFLRCDKLTALTVGKGVRSIGERAFYAGLLERVYISSDAALKALENDVYYIQSIKKVGIERGIKATEFLAKSYRHTRPVSFEGRDYTVYCNEKYRQSEGETPLGADGTSLGDNYGITENIGLVVILYVLGALVGNLLIVIAVVIIVKKLRKRRG